MTDNSMWNWWLCALNEWWNTRELPESWFQTDADSMYSGSRTGWSTHLEVREICLECGQRPFACDCYDSLTIYFLH